MSEDFRSQVDAQSEDDRIGSERINSERINNQVNVEKGRNNEKYRANKKKDMETAEEYTPQRDTVKRVKPEFDTQENDH